MTATREEKHACVKRELGLRRSVYPNLVSRGKMRQAEADHELRVMAAIAADYAPEPPPNLFDQRPPSLDEALLVISQEIIATELRAKRAESVSEAVGLHGRLPGLRVAEKLLERLRDGARAQPKEVEHGG